MTDGNYIQGCATRWKGKSREDARRWRGWYCVRQPDHTGSCAMEPRWWRKILNMISK